MTHTDSGTGIHPTLVPANTTWLKGFSGADSALKSPVSVRANSHIFRTTFNAACPLDTAVKKCLQPQTGKPDPLAATTQFSALTRVNQAFKNGASRFRVPAPYNIAPELGIFSMAWVDGKALSDKLHHVGAVVHGAEWMHGVGAWLGYFHQVGPLKTESVSLEQRRLRVARPPVLTTAGVTPSRVTQALQAAAETMRHEQVAVTWLHGDCKADNFILSGHDIYGIDLSLCHENPVEYDLAMFFNNWDLLLYNPKLLPLWPLKKRFENAFWAGYQSTGPKVSARYLAWVRLNFLLSPWQTLNNSTAATGNRWVMKKIYSKMADNLTAQLLESHLIQHQP